MEALKDARDSTVSGITMKVINESIKEPAPPPPRNGSAKKRQLQAPPSSTSKRPPSFQCPRCGHFGCPCKGTHPTTAGIVRYRECKRCEWVFQTVQKHAEPGKAISLVEEIRG